MELADVTDSKSVGLIIRVGSSPTTGTMSSGDNGFGYHHSIFVTFREEKHIVIIENTPTTGKNTVMKTV